jgi:hypothetical protein
MPSSTNVPSSISSAIRSRAVSFSRSCCLAIFSSPPPSLIAHALDDVLGGQGERQLGAQVVERVIERHVQLTAHRFLAKPHDHG